MALRPTGVYHIQSGLYDTAQALADKVRANHIASVPNGHYYCIRNPVDTRAARVRR